MTRRSTTRSPRRPVARPTVGDRRAAQAAAARPRPGRRRELRQGPARGRRRDGLRPVRPADRVPARAADARPLSVAARRAAARGHHLHRDDGRGARGGPRPRARRGGLRGPGRPRLHGGRDVPGDRRATRTRRVPRPRRSGNRSGSPGRSPTSASRSCAASCGRTVEACRRAYLMHETDELGRRPARPRPARERADLPRLGAGSGPPDAHEQPRPGGRRGPRPPRRLRRDRPRGAVVGGVRRDRPRAPGARRRRDAAHPVGQAGRGRPDASVGAARPHRQLEPRRQVGDLGRLPRPRAAAA